MAGTALTSPVKKRDAQSFVLGLSLYITIIYLPFATAVPMSFSSSQYRLVVATCCVLVAGMTLISGFATKTPLIIVPALGTTFLIAPFLTQLNWLTLSLSCLSAGIIAAFLGASGLRRHLLDHLPPEILMGIRAAIGTLIGSSAIATLQECAGRNGHTQPDLLYVGFVIAVIALSLWDRLSDLLALVMTVPKNPVFRALTQLHYIAVPVALALFCYWSGFEMDSGLGHVPSGMAPLTESAQLLMAVPLTFSMAFILITDIPGHPYEFLSRSPSMQQKLDRDDDLRDKQIERGFLVDALGAGVSAGLIGFHIPIAPSIYVAENAVAHEFEWTSYGGATVAAICFLATGLALFAFPQAVTLAGGYITLGVTPVLFFIAIKMVSRSMFIGVDLVSELVPEYVEGGKRALGAERRKRAHVTSAEALDFYVPGALMILLTFTRVGLSLSLPVGIVASSILRYSRKKRRSNEEETAPEVNGTLFTFAFISIIFWIAVHLGSGS
jgi:xanthine/uracil/vitamin C permease (AzgA family)